jgi:predicted phosphoribosyltransferase
MFIKTIKNNETNYVAELPRGAIDVGFTCSKRLEVPLVVIEYILLLNPVWQNRNRHAG